MSRNDELKRIASDGYMLNKIKLEQTSQV